MGTVTSFLRKLDDSPRRTLTPTLSQGGKEEEKRERGNKKRGRGRKKRVYYEKN
jgi:hypothetical protein